MSLSALRRARRACWKFARIVIAGGLLAVLVFDQADRAARSALWSLPRTDYLQTANDLRAQSQFDDAITVLHAGIADADDDRERAELAAALTDTIKEQHSVLRRAKAVARGAISGRGESVEELVGAIGTDLFVIGDIRDLTIQAANWSRSEEVDELIVALSTAGLVTTLLPQLDGAVGTVKTAAKSGFIKPAFARRIARMVRSGSRTAKNGDARRLFENVRSLQKATSTSTALRLLRHVDDPQDIARIAKYVGKSRRGAYALLAAGDDGVAALRAGGRNVDWIASAAKHGPDGRRWLRTAVRVGVKPHPLLGLAKGMYKGNVPRFVPQLLQALDQAYWWFVPGLAVWLFLEVGFLVMPRRSKKHSSQTTIVDPQADLVPA